MHINFWTVIANEFSDEVFKNKTTNQESIKQSSEVLDFLLKGFRSLSLTIHNKSLKYGLLYKTMYVA